MICNDKSQLERAMLSCPFYKSPVCYTVNLADGRTFWRVVHVDDSNRCKRCRNATRGYRGDSIRIRCQPGHTWDLCPSCGNPYYHFSRVMRTLKRGYRWTRDRSAWITCTGFYGGGVLH